MSQGRTVVRELFINKKDSSSSRSVEMYRPVFVEIRRHFGFPSCRVIVYVYFLSFETRRTNTLAVRVPKTKEHKCILLVSVPEGFSDKENR